MLEPPPDDLAPPTAPGFVDAVIAAARRRVRRGRAVAGSAIAIVVVVLGVPVAVELARTDTSGSSAAVAPSAAARVERFAAPSSRATPAVGPDEVAVDAALVRHVVAASGPSVASVEIRTAICANADRASSTCVGGRTLTPAMQEQILAGISGSPPVRFVDAAAQDPPGSSGPGGQRVFLTLGPARIAGNRATAWVQSWCGADCVRGDGYVVTRRSGAWRVTGSYAGYVS